MINQNEILTIDKSTLKPTLIWFKWNEYDVKIIKKCKMWDKTMTIRTKKALEIIQKYKDKLNIIDKEFGEFVELGTPINVIFQIKLSEELDKIDEYNG